MRLSQLFAVTLTSASMVSTTVSAAGLPPMTDAIKGDMVGKRQISAADLPELTGEEKEELYKLYRVYKSVKKIKDFNELAGKIPPGQTLEKLAKKLGGGAKATKIQSKLNDFPGQPQTVIFSYVMGIGQCLYQGKSFSDAVECGKTKVRELGDNDVANVPETCNNRLGQFKLLGRGRPAPY